MFNRLKARRERRQQEKQARYKIQGLMDLVKVRDEHLVYHQEPGYAEIHTAIDRLIDHWPYTMEWD